MVGNLQSFFRAVEAHGDLLIGVSAVVTLGIAVHTLTTWRKSTGIGRMLHTFALIGASAGFFAAIASIQGSKSLQRHVLDLEGQLEKVDRRTDRRVISHEQKQRFNRLTGKILKDRVIVNAIQGSSDGPRYAAELTSFLRGAGFDAIRDKSVNYVSGPDGVPKDVEMHFDEDAPQFTRQLGEALLESGMVDRIYSSKGIRSGVYVSVGSLEP